MHDFTTLSRSATLPAPTDDARVVARVAAGLFAEVDTSGGIRLLGVGVSGLADWVQEDLFASAERQALTDTPEPADVVPFPAGGSPAWTCCTPSTGRAGCGAAAGAASRCVSRPPTPRPARSVRSPPTTPTCPGPALTA